MAKMTKTPCEQVEYAIRTLTTMAHLIWNFWWWRNFLHIGSLGLRGWRAMAGQAGGGQVLTAETEEWASRCLNGFIANH